MAQIEAKFEDKFAMVTMKQTPQKAYYEPPHATYIRQQQQFSINNPPATINVPSQQQFQTQYPFQQQQQS